MEANDETGLLILYLKCYSFVHFVVLVLGAADAPVTGGTVKPTADLVPKKSAQGVPKAPSSQPAAANVDTTAPATPTKGTYF